MINSSEDKAYWYFRLNGFFLIDNFVIHRSNNVKYSADADLIGIRMPYVFEEIGGRPDDWDTRLFQNFDPKSIIGIICQVKGGDIGKEQLFREPYLSYSIDRIGLTEDRDTIITQLKNSPIATFTNDLGHLCQIALVLISRDRPPENENYFYFSLDYIYDFILERIEKYPKEKYADRNFFNSIGFQTLIERNEFERRRKNKNNL
jgi:hypothetical protein